MRTPAFRVGAADKLRALAHYERVSDHYDQRVARGALRWLRHRERACVLKLLALDDGARTAIDVGCGAGFYALSAKRAGLVVCAVDASPGMLRAVSGEVDDARLADLEEVSFEGVYDRVICAGVLEFTVDPEAALQKLFSLVAAGGRVVLLLPRAGIGGAIYRFEKWMFGVRVNLFTSAWIRQVAAEAGFVVDTIECPLPTNMAVSLKRKTLQPRGAHVASRHLTVVPRGVVPEGGTRLSR